MLGINDGPGAKKSKDDDTEDSESDSSSGEETLDNEVEISVCQAAGMTLN